MQRSVVKRTIKYHCLVDQYQWGSSIWPIYDQEEDYVTVGANYGTIQLSVSS